MKVQTLNLTRSRRLRAGTTSLRHALLWLGFPCLSACQALPIEQTGALQSYANLTEADGLLTKSRLYVDKSALVGVQRLLIVPTRFAGAAAKLVKQSDERRLIANAVDRALCANLSERFTVVSSGQTADLTIHAVVSQITLTDEVAAGVSKGLSIAGSALGGGMVPRIPYGLGSLTVEAEALDARGQQRAAMIWARGASPLGSSATLSPISDAYQVADKFGEDFGQLVVSGESPFGRFPSLMSEERLNLALGLPAKHSACEVYGPGPGVAGALGVAVGLPPDVTDRGVGVFD